ncbi:F-box and WD-40 domain protein 1/11 [Entomortierella parvispora]|uniref:F-box and WD-40 domain protein 1/11 n=1 Tax=Entomortierella parvispora TaxID=205924 RepID=A0A9P3HGK3_9FUNG|nr:F-box and WD-40 domain protein 1/11 [Entomortierella parvispora]
MKAIHHLQALFLPSTTNDAIVGPTSSQKSDAILDDMTASKRLRSNEVALSPCSVQEYNGPRIDFLSKLPYEIATYILCFVDIHTLAILSLTSRKWASLATDNEVWRNMYVQQSYWLRPRQQQVNGVPLPINWKRLYQSQLLLDERWATDPVKTKLLGHSDSVYCIHFDGTKIVTGSRDKTIKFWDYHTLQCIDTLEGHTQSVLCLKFDEKMMVSGSSDRTIIVWDMKSRKMTHHLLGHTAGVLDVCFNDRYIISCSKDATIKIWNRETKTLVRTLEGHRGPVNAVQLYENQIVSASGDGLVKLWDLTTGRCERDFIGHNRGLACVQFDGTRIASGSNDTTIRIWDAATGECTQVLRGHIGLVRTLHFDQNRIVSGSYDNTVKVWDMATGQWTKDLSDGHTSWVFDVQFAASRIIRYCADLRTRHPMLARTGSAF